MVAFTNTCLIAGAHTALAMNLAPNCALEPFLIQCRNVSIRSAEEADASTVVDEVSEARGQQTAPLQFDHGVTIVEKYCACKASKQKDTM